jgi:hypothetical protein
MNKRILCAVAFAAILAAGTPAATFAKSSHDHGSGSTSASTVHVERSHNDARREARRNANPDSGCNAIFRNDTRPGEECGGD